MRRYPPSPDIVYQAEKEGDTELWWEGRATWLWISEVENNPCEFKGTLSDLLRFQAKRKLGVSCYRDKESESGYSAKTMG